MGTRLYRANQHHLHGLPWYEIPTRTTEQSDHGRTIQAAPLGDYLGCPTIDFPSSTHALLIERYTHRTSGRGGWAGCRAGLDRRGTGPDRTATGAENRVADRHRGGNQVAHTEIQAIKIATPAAVEWILDKAIQTHGAGQDFPLAGLWAHGVTRCPRPGHQGYDRHALGC